MYFDPTQNKGTEYMWEFPPNLDKIEFRLNDKPFRWEGGLTGFRTRAKAEGDSGKKFSAAGFGNRDALIYYRDQLDDGVFDNEFEEIFPRVQGRWKDVIVLEFNEDRLEEHNTLLVSTHFNSGNSPEGKLIAGVFVSEETVVDSGGKWSIRRPPQ